MSFFIRRFFNRDRKVSGDLSFLSSSRRGSLPFSHTARRKTAKGVEGRATSPNLKESHFKLFSGEEVKISDMRSAAFLYEVSASLVAYCKRILLQINGFCSGKVGLIPRSFPRGGFNLFRVQLFPGRLNSSLIVTFFYKVSALPVAYCKRLLLQVNGFCSGKVSLIPRSFPRGGFNLFRVNFSRLAVFLYGASASLYRKIYLFIEKFTVNNSGFFKLIYMGDSQFDTPRFSVGRLHLNRRLLLKSRALVSVLTGLIHHSFQRRSFVKSAGAVASHRFQWVAVLMVVGFSGFTAIAENQSECDKKIEEAKTIKKGDQKISAKRYAHSLIAGLEKNCSSGLFLIPPPVTAEGREGIQNQDEIDKQKDRQNLCIDVTKICNITPKKVGDKSDCEEAVGEFKEAKKEANSKCSRLNSSDITQCMSIMRSCEDCPDEKKGKRCVTLPGRAKCPQLAGTDLEDLKEEIRDSKDAKKDLQQDIKELQDEIVEKQGELVTAEKEYKEDIHTLQSELQTNQEEMEREVKESQAEIDGNTQKAIDTVKGELSKSLKLQHSFVNGIAKVDRTRRDETAKIHRECRHTASAQLAAYRQYRRKAIRDGRYGNKGVRKVMGKARVSFTKQDNIRYRSYHSACLTENADRFKTIEENYRTAMRMIEQQKQQVLAQFKAMQAQVQQLNNQAYQQKNQIVQDFAKNTEKALKKFGANQARRTENYKGERGQLGRGLATLNAQLQKKQGELDAVTEQEGLHTAYMQSARQKGASSKSSDGESRVQEAQHALVELPSTVRQAYTKCCAENVVIDDSSSKAGDAWRTAAESDKTIGGCKPFLKDFNDAYNSSIKFEQYEHEENRKRMKRRMDGGSR